MRISKILVFLSPIFLILFFWRNTIIHLSTHLFDWNTVPFAIWTLQNNLRHMSLLDLTIYNETNAMFPFPLSLSFNEHMYFPSMIIYPISLFTNNAILQFNILAIFNHIMIYFAAFLLIGRFVKDVKAKSLFGLFIALSPFVVSNLGTVYLVFFWPLLLSFYFLLHPNRQIYHYMLAGLFLGWQCMSSFYLGPGGLIIILLYYLLRFFVPQLFSFVSYSKKEFEDKRKAFLYSYYSFLDGEKPSSLVRIGAELAIILIMFLIVIEPTLEAYFQMGGLYKISFLHRGMGAPLASWPLFAFLGIGVFLTARYEFLFSQVKKSQFKAAFFISIFILLLLGFYRYPLASTQVEWWTKGYEVTKQICSENPAPLLEYPFDYRAKDRTYLKDVSYKNVILLASTFHPCDILSGFTGYQPKKYGEYRNFLQNNTFNRGSLKLLTDLNFKYIKFNYFAMNDNEKKQIQDFMKFGYAKKLYEDNDILLVQIRKLTKSELIEK